MTDSGIRMTNHVDARPSGHPTARRATATVRALSRLIRIEYCILGAAGVLLGAFLTTGAVSSIQVFLSALAVFFVAVACYAFDDVSDQDCDRLNGRMDRPLVTSELTSTFAIRVGFASLILAAAATALAASAAGVLIVLGVGAALAYNRWLRGVIVLKNVLFAAVFPVPLAIGWLAGGGSAGMLFAYFVALVFIAGLGFETMIDVADAEGDRQSGIVTFATRYGTPLSARVAAGFHVAASAMIVLLFFLPVDDRLQWNLPFLALAVAAGLLNSHIGVRLVRHHETALVFTLKRLAFVTLNAGMAAIVLGLLAAKP